MCGQVSDASNRIALNLYVGAEHLPNERLQATKLHDEQLVVSCCMSSVRAPPTRLGVRTVHRKVSQSRTCSPLHFSVMAAEKEEDGVQCVPADGADFLFGDFGKCKRSAALEVDVVREGEYCQRGERRVPEEVGCSTVLIHRREN